MESQRCNLCNAKITPAEAATYGGTRCETCWTGSCPPKTPARRYVYRGRVPEDYYLSEAEAKAVLRARSDGRLR